jgi:integrase
MEKQGKKKRKKRKHLVVKNGSIKVKIYTTPSHECKSYTVVYWQDGERKRPTFPTLEKAKAEAELVVNRLGTAQGDVLTLTSADRAAYLRAKEILDAVGTSIEVAAAQFAHAKKVLGDTPLATAVEYYRKKHLSKIEPKTCKEVSDELVKVKTADKLSARYLQCMRYCLGKFTKKFGTEIIESVTGTQIDDWLRTSGLSPRTRNNLRSTVQTLFNYAKARRYVPKDHDEIESVQLVKDRDGEIEVFTPDELTEVLAFTDERLIPFLTLGAFAGIRHAEIQRLDWKDIRFDDGIIELHASKAKTASRRTIPLLDNLKAWLLPFKKDTGAVASHANMAFELHQLVKRINGKRAERDVKEAFAWKHNALRHSFISYRVAETQNVNQVALEAGNSPQMIFRHYRELVRPADAKQWFLITKESVAAANVEWEKQRKIIALPKAEAA